MIKIYPPLQDAYIYDGKVWKQGDDLIPEDLALRLGLISAEEAVNLPDDIPYRDELIDAGYGNLPTLVDYNNFVSIPGIGPKRGAELREYFEDHPEYA